MPHALGLLSRPFKNHAERMGRFGGQRCSSTSPAHDDAQWRDVSFAAAKFLTSLDRHDFTGIAKAISLRSGKVVRTAGRGRI